MEEENETQPLPASERRERERCYRLERGEGLPDKEGGASHGGGRHKGPGSPGLMAEGAEGAMLVAPIGHRGQ
ncbi:hypothetical protein U1Q18_017557 [Sarracenia purpurea var. burkii]